MSSSSSSRTDARLKDAQGLTLTLGARVIVPQDTRLSGEISISSGTVLHPLCSLLATGGPIHLGSNCLLEENVVILNSSTSHQPLLIGSGNHFEVGSRIEMLQGGRVTLGDWNTFEVRSCLVSRRGETRVGDWCKMGVGVVVEDLHGKHANEGPSQQDLEAILRVGLDEEEDQPGKLLPRSSAGNEGTLALPDQSVSRRPSTGSIATATIPEEDEEDGGMGQLETIAVAGPGTDSANTGTGTAVSATATATATATASASTTSDTPLALPSQPSLVIPDYSVLHSASSYNTSFYDSSPTFYRIRTRSGEGLGQEEAAFAKHLDYLREFLPRNHKLRKI